MIWQNYVQQKINREEQRSIYINYIKKVKIFSNLKDMLCKNDFILFFLNLFTSISIIIINNKIYFFSSR
jgi:hypothetical protein